MNIVMFTIKIPQISIFRIFLPQTAKDMRMVSNKPCLSYLETALCWQNFLLVRFCGLIRPANLIKPTSLTILG